MLQSNLQTLYLNLNNFTPCVCLVQLKLLFPEVFFAKPKSSRNSSIESFVVCRCISEVAFACLVALTLRAMLSLTCVFHSMSSLTCVFHSMSSFTCVLHSMSSFTCMFYSMSRVADGGHVHKPLGPSLSTTQQVPPSMCPNFCNTRNPCRLPSLCCAEALLPPPSSTPPP